MADLDTNAYYALGVPAYLAAMALEHRAARARGERAYSFGVTLGNLSAGLGEVVLGLFLGPYLLALYDWAYAHLAIVHWPRGSWVPWALAFALGDLGYWVYHRAGHRVAALWAIHGVHHQAEEFNVSVAIRHPWLSDTYAALFYAPLPLLGVTSTQFFFAIAMISFYAFTAHTRVFLRTGLWLFVSPRTHVLHHARNRPYRGMNLGAMFTLWDRLFGTHVEPDPSVPIELGMPAGYRTHDGARAQWIGWEDLVRLARQTPRWQDKVRVFVGPPGWLPPGATLPTRAVARTDTEIPEDVRRYVLVQFSAVVLFAVDVLWLRDRHPLSVELPSALALLFSLASLGAMLDGRAVSLPRERARLALVVALGAWLLAAPRYALTGTALVAWALGSWAFIPRRVEHGALAPRA